MGTRKRETPMNIDLCENPACQQQILLSNVLQVTRVTSIQLLFQ